MKLPGPCTILCNGFLVWIFFLNRKEEDEEEEEEIFYSYLEKLRYGLRRESFVEVEVWFLQRELKGNKFDPQDFDALGHEAEEGNECAFKPLHESVRLRIISKFGSGLFYDSLSLSRRSSLGL